MTADLNRYVGQWIAQVGEEIVEAESTAQEVVAELRTTGRRASVWRVPLTKDEAEA